MTAKETWNVSFRFDRPTFAALRYLCLFWGPEGGKRNAPLAPIKVLRGLIREAAIARGYTGYDTSSPSGTRS